MASFGSSWAFYAEGSSDDEESLDEADLEDGVAEASTRNNPFQEAQQQQQAPPQLLPVKSRRTRVRAANTNVVAVDLGTLANEAPLATGEGTFCAGCQAALSVHSVISSGAKPVGGDQAQVQQQVQEAPGGGGGGQASPAGGDADDDDAAEEGDDDDDNMEDDDHQWWCCEYCGHVNEVHLEAEEIPTTDTVDYMLEAAPVVQQDGAASAAGGAAGADEAVIVFVIDKSGSMCVTTEVEGRHNLKGGDDMERLARELNPQGEAQRMPGRRRQVTYVSRMQCVQAAIETQIQALVQDFPSRRVALVTFGSEVTIVGDAAQGTNAVEVTGDMLNSVEQLRSQADRCPALRPVAESHKELLTKLWALEPSGTTALGPALVVGNHLASKGGAGSAVILCTDGLANVGVGNLEELITQVEEDEAEAFYRSQGQTARDAGVMTSVISIEGSQCKMELLGLVAEESNGDVNIVDPLALTTNFATILATPTVATDCRVTFVVHQGLNIRELNADVGCRLEKEVGNATADTSLTLEYVIRRGAGAANLPQLPFQVMIHYKRLDGTRLVRVISKTQRVTRDRSVAESAAKLHVLRDNATRQAAMVAQAGDYQSARVRMVAQERLMGRAAHAQGQSSFYEGYVSKAAALDRELKSAVEEESRSTDRTASSSRTRKTKRKDALSNMCYRMKKGH